MKINCAMYTVKMNKPNNLYPTDRTKKCGNNTKTTRFHYSTRVSLAMRIHNSKIDSKPLIHSDCDMVW